MHVASVGIAVFPVLMPPVDTAAPSVFEIQEIVFLGLSNLAHYWNP